MLEFGLDYRVETSCADFIIGLPGGARGAGIRERKRMGENTHYTEDVETGKIENTERLVLEW